MNIEQFNSFLQDEGIIFSFSGMLTQDMLACLGDNLLCKLNSCDVSPKISNNLFGIFVEQIHNVISYSKEKNIIDKYKFESMGIAMVGYCKQKQKYYSASCNKIEQSSCVLIKDKIAKINSLDEVQVKSLYKEARRSGENKHERGAGLGFLEMKKRSSEALEYQIINQDDGSALFYIKVYV